MAFNIDDLVAEGLTYPKKRSCGDCTLCCTTQRVPELEKPEYTPCKFCKAKQGCTIYEDRPKSCKTFDCAWLQGEMPDWMHPYKSHVLIEKIKDFPIVLALHEPEYDWLTPEVEKVLNKEYQSKGVAVVATNGMALLPKGWTAETCKQHIKNAAKVMGVIK